MARNWKNREIFVLKWNGKVYETTNSSKEGALTAIAFNKNYGFLDDERKDILNNGVVLTKAEYQKGKCKSTEPVLRYSEEPEIFSRDGMEHEVATMYCQGDIAGNWEDALKKAQKLSYGSLIFEFYKNKKI